MQGAAQQGDAVVACAHPVIDGIRTCYCHWMDPTRKTRGNGYVQHYDAARAASGNSWFGWPQDLVESWQRYYDQVMGGD